MLCFRTCIFPKSSVSTLPHDAVSRESDAEVWSLRRRIVGWRGVDLCNCFVVAMNPWRGRGNGTYPSKSPKEMLSGWQVGKE
jgi:hypothetical protein